jgi:hypothetical protein
MVQGISPESGGKDRRAERAGRRPLDRWAVVPLLLLLIAACTTAPKPGMTVLQPPERPYEYPWVDPYAATVVGTPPVLKADLPNKISIDELELQIFPDRPIPEIFWYNSALRFSLVSQHHKAPLIFIIAGTGAAHDSKLTEVLQRAFFDAGFHAISLPSPTHPNFIVNASTTSVPGRIGDDARDLYRAMRLAYAEVKDRIEVSDFHLTGYSLGGWHAAFVAKLDETEGAFGFGKVLMINPPVSLYNSVRILDHMLDDTLPEGTGQYNAFIDDVFEAFSQVYSQSAAVDFDELVYQAYVEFVPTETTLQSLIGLDFRLSSNNMAFAADVMTDYGYVVPRGTKLDSLSSLTDYFDHGMTLSFESYFDGFLYPYFKARDPSLTREALINEASLHSIQDYLAGADKIGLLTNEDDIILAPGEIEYLRTLFGSRARLFPTGGHCGNLDDRHVVYDMVDFFKQ